MGGIRAARGPINGSVSAEFVNDALTRAERLRGLRRRRRTWLLLAVGIEVIYAVVTLAAVVLGAWVLVGPIAVLLALVVLASLRGLSLGRQIEGELER